MFNLWKYTLNVRNNISFLELEWSSWSDCYIVSNGKKRYNTLLSGKPHKKFSECGIQKLSGRQYRTSRCLDNGFMEECIAAGKEHQRQTRKCTPSCKQSILKSRPPKYLYDNTFDKKNKLKNEKRFQQHQSKSEDYEVVTNGDVEEVKRRSKKTLFKQGESKEDIELHRNHIIKNTLDDNEVNNANNVVQVNHNRITEKINDFVDDLLNISLPIMSNLSTKTTTNKEQEIYGKNLSHTHTHT